MLHFSPIFHEINHVVVTLKVLQAGDKNYLSMQRDHLVVGHRNEPNLLKIHPQRLYQFLELVFWCGLKKVVHVFFAYL